MKNRLNLPDVWGRGGALFAFSGFDGKTDAVHLFTASTSSEGRGLRFHTVNNTSLDFRVLGPKEPSFEDEFVVGDAISTVAVLPGGKVRLRYVFLDDRTIVGDIRCLEGTVSAGLEVWTGSPEFEEEANSLVCTVGEEQFRLAVSGPASYMIRKGLFADLKVGESLNFAFTYSFGKPFTHNDKALDADISSIINKRLVFFESLPIPNAGDGVRDVTYYKCASVQKVNACSAEGAIPFGWSTPNRWPHKMMWIWDSAFNALGYRHFKPEWAIGSIKSVLSRQRPNGFIPHKMTVDGEGESEIVQPPILAWAAWKVYGTSGDREFLEYCYPCIKKMLEYDVQSLDRDNSGLSEWENGFASGMDNSPRFDNPVGDAVDLNAYIVNDLRHLALIAKELGYEGDIAGFNTLADERAEAMNRAFWDEEDGLYYDVLASGGKNRVRTGACLIPLFGGICSEEQAERLVKNLTDTEGFWRPFPVATVDVREKSYLKDMWRGPVWIVFNYLFMEGLSRYGYNDIAGKLKEATVAEIARWYASDGVIYEYYDSESAVSPSELQRKGRPGSELGPFDWNRNIRDYNWSAALYIDLVLSGAPKSNS